MDLYHFTADLFIKGIRKEGLTKGVMPVIRNGKNGLLSYVQWLTVNGEFKQAFCEGSSLSYDRAENRLRVVVPENFRKNLLKWDLFKAMVIVQGFDIFPEFDNHDDCKNWFVYLGKIPPQWICQRTRKINQPKGAI